MARSDLPGWAMGAMGVLVTALAMFGLAAREVELNLGPGDTPFVSGFAEDSDVDDKVGWHWTTYAARVDFPFTTSGSDVDATLRYARVFGEEAVVAVSVGLVRGEIFRARGGEVRSTTVAADQVRGPLVVGIQIDSHERRNMGLRMDRLKLSVRSGAPFRLRWQAALRPVVAALVLFAALLILGSSATVAGGLTLLAALSFVACAIRDLFDAWRQAGLASEMLIIVTLVLFVAKRGIERWAGVARKDASMLAIAALLTMLFRLFLVSHPDFYYPDLLTHARVVDAIRGEGPSFFLHPADALNAQGAWTKPVMGSVSSLPYAVMFHTPFAVLASLFALSTDQIETALKAGSSLISVLPIPLGGALAARLSLPPLAALLLCVIPTYVSRLSFALLPALFGHVFDLTVLLAVASALGDEGQKPQGSLFRVAVVVMLGHLAYTSSVVNEAVFLIVLAGVWLVAGGPGLSVAVRLVVIESVAALGALALYYRHFVADGLLLVPRILGLGVPGDQPAASVYPVVSFWALLLERTGTFFGWSWVGLAVAGVLFGDRVVMGSKVIRGWLLTYLVLVLLRAKIPDVFRYGHETLFVTPIAALLAGSALILAWRKGTPSRLAAAAAGLALLLVSFREQWSAIAEQLANAL